MTTTPRIEVPSPSGLLRTLSERRRLVLGVLATFTAFGLALNAFTPPVYRATVRVEFPRTAERSPWTGQAAPGGNFQSENMALFTSAELITNRVLLGRLATDLSRSEPALLAQSDAAKRREGGLHWLRVPIARATGGTATPAGTGIEYDPVVLGSRVDRLERAIAVEPVADTRLVDIKVEDSDPVMARETADRLARLFVEWQLQRTASTDTSGLTFVVGEIAQVKDRIEATSAALARLGGPRERVTHVRTRVEGSSSPSSYAKDLARAEGELAEARATYRDAHPRIQGLVGEVQALRQQASRETRVGGYQTRAVRSFVPAPRQAVLENDLAVDEALYARLVSRAREIGLERQMATPAVAVVEPATVEADPIRPRPLLNLAVCLLAGALVAVGLALVKGSLSRTIRSAHDAEELIGLPVLAVIPKRA
ncbi:MAG: GNVR domain-containing protein [Candidatus Eisenbacteria bacterium]